MKNKTNPFGNSRYMQGLFKPNFPDKYKGNPKNIQFRSSWEFSFMMKLDKDPTIVEWSSEELWIGYVSPKDQKWHRYFPDVIYKKKNPDETVDIYMVEIKPSAQTKKPVNKTGKRATKTMLTEAMTYAINNSKWAYAAKYCEKRGWKFRIITEKELFT